MSNKAALWSGGMVSAALLLAVAMPVLAADEEPAEVDVAEAPVQLEEVVVTGSRIHIPNLASANPVYHVDAETLSYQGNVRVEDTLRILPQVFSTQNAGISNGATGTATLNLRNLGAQRTLVLVNGRRLPIGSPLQGGIGADINQIPGSLIKSVEVLTGGSSATYGADAVAGVVNFLMADDFEGVKLDYQFSQYQHGNDNDRWQGIVRDAGYSPATGSSWDGDISNVSLVMGKNLGRRGNVTVYGTYRNIEAVLHGDRDYSSCDLINGLTACGGSGTTPQGTFSDFGALGSRGFEKGFDYKVEDHRFVPRDGTVYNYAPTNYFQRPDTRWTAGLFANYDVHDKVEAYTEFMFMDDQSVAQIAPSGSFFHPDTLNCDNPLLSPQQFEAVCGAYGLTKDDVQTVRIGRRNVEGGSRQDDLRHTSYRSVFGLRGDLSDRWFYELHYQYSKVNMKSTYRNDLSITRIKRSLDVVEHPGTGEPVCRSVLDGSDPGCVPWNIFREGGVTPDMVNYLSLPLTAEGSTDQTVISGYLTGHLGRYGIKSPFAENSVDVVLGGEYREENLRFAPGAAYRSGDGAGQGGARPPVSGGFDVKEFFFEAGIPLVEGAPYAEEFGLDVGYRYSDYDFDLQTNTFGVRSVWDVNSGVKLRASFQRAIRGPNVRERFRPQGLNLFDMPADPCGGPVTNGQTAAGRTFEECARSGVTAAQFGNIAHSPAKQYNFLQGGNRDLGAEEADTYSFGLVWAPSFVAGFNFSVDYYSIRIQKGISALNPQFILNECLDGNTAQCAKVRRGQGGDLWVGSDVDSSGHIVSLLDNLAIEKVQGYDVTALYDLDVGEWGRLNFNDILSVTATWDQQELEGAPIEDCLGKWGLTCGSPTPDVRNNLRATWITPWGVRPSLMWRYVSGVEALSDTGVDLGERHYIDLAAIWDFADYASLRAGINNLFDREPPVAGQQAGPSISGNGGTFPGLYDVLGRYFFFGLTANFL
ncbi:MAG: TonB-dependent receptor [Nitrospira sp.]|nr:TonB-dependent receptor [Nitrospira sp.]